MLKLIAVDGSIFYLDVSDIFSMSHLSESYLSERPVVGSDATKLPGEFSLVVTLPDKSLSHLNVTKESFTVALEAFKKWCG